MVHVQPWPLIEIIHSLWEVRIVIDDASPDNKARRLRPQEERRCRLPYHRELSRQCPLPTRLVLQSSEAYCAWSDPGASRHSIAFQLLRCVADSNVQHSKFRA